MLAQARERGAGVSFSQGKGEHLDFPASSFDLIFSVDVIHHVTDRRAYFEEAWRVLAPGGVSALSPTRNGSSTTAYLLLWGEKIGI